MNVGLKELAVDHPFHAVNGTWKAVMFNTDLLGTILLLGGRSNPEFAAGAMLRDILNLVHDSLALKSGLEFLFLRFPIRQCRLIS